MEETELDQEQVGECRVEGIKYSIMEQAENSVIIQKTLLTQDLDGTKLLSFTLPSLCIITYAD